LLLGLVFFSCASPRAASLLKAAAVFQWIATTLALLKTAILVHTLLWCPRL